MRPAGRPFLPATAAPTAVSSMPSQRPAFIAGRAAPRACRGASMCASSPKPPPPKPPASGRASSAAARHLAAIERACALLRDSETVPSLDRLAAAAGMSRYHFHRVFKQLTGTTPREYARARRLDRFADALAAGQSVAASVYAAGFGSSSRAYEEAPQGLGMTPGKRRRGGGGETIRFVTVATPLGWALVAATHRGLCMTALADDRDSLVAQLRARFPAASLVAEDAQLREWAERI